MGEEDPEGGDKLGQRDALVALPLLERLGVVNEDDEVVKLALVVDLGLGGFAAGHDGGREVQLSCCADTAGYRVTCRSLARMSRNGWTA